MNCNVPVAEATQDEAVLPARVQEALGQLVGAAREGLLALSVEVGLGVLRELLVSELEEIVGPKGRHNPDRGAVRHGHEDGEVTLGGRRVGVGRPRVRTADGESEVPLETYEHFADRDQLGDVVLERMLAGVSTRRFRRVQEPVGSEVEDDARSTSKSAVSRMFVDRTRQQLCRLMNRPLSDLRLAVMMLDGIDLHGSINVVALGITTEGDKLAKDGLITTRQASLNAADRLVAPPKGLLTLGFDPARFQTEPPACYRASWQLSGRDSHPLATTSLCWIHLINKHPPTLGAQLESSKQPSGPRCSSGGKAGTSPSPALSAGGVAYQRVSSGHADPPAISGGSNSLSRPATKITCMR